VQLGETRGRPVETSPREDVRERRIRRLRARPRILGHVAQRPAAEHKPARGIVLTGQDLEQARLARAVAPDQAHLVARGDGEARVREDAARGDVDGETTDLKHDGMLRAAPRDVLSHIKRPGGRSK